MTVLNNTVSLSNSLPRHQTSPLNGSYLSSRFAIFQINDTKFLNSVKSMWKYTKFAWKMIKSGFWTRSPPLLPQWLTFSLRVICRCFRSREESLLLAVNLWSLCRCFRSRERTQVIGGGVRGQKHDYVHFLTNICVLLHTFDRISNFQLVCPKLEKRERR